MSEPLDDLPAADILLPASDIHKLAGQADSTNVRSAPPGGLAGAAEENSALLQKLDQIDYSRYQNPELRASIESILSVPGTLRVFLCVIGVAFPCCEFLIVWMFRDKPWLTLGSAAIIGLVASLGLAVLLGITLCLQRVLSEIVKVVDKTLDIVGQVITDVGATGDRGFVTTAAAVFGGVSRNLILPIVENVVRAQLGFLGRPLLWVYRRVFARTVDAATNRILLAATKIQVPGRERLAGASETVGVRLKSSAETADWLLQAIRPYAVGGTRALTLGLLLPAWLLLGLASLATAVLFWLARSWT